MYCQSSERIARKLTLDTESSQSIKSATIYLFHVIGEKERKSEGYENIKCRKKDINIGKRERQRESDRILNQREDIHRGLHREMGRDRS